MITALDQVDILAEQLKKLLPMKPENKQRLDKKFRLEFNYNSNHIEGNTLTYGETELLLIFGDTKGPHSMRELQEMKGHDVAYHLIEDWAGNNEHVLTERDVKNLNEIILFEPFWKDAITQDGQPTRRIIKVGDYKEHPNSVRLHNGEIFEYTKPSETPMAMQELIDWYRSENKTTHPVTLAAMLHYKFVRIHPFDDGNGRVSRLLMNYVLLRNELPPVIIKSEDKANYLRALNRADIGDYESFISYVAEQVVWSLELAVKAANGEVIAEPDDWQKKLQIIKTQTSQNEHLKKTRGENAVKHVVLNSIIPLMKEIVVRLSEFNELFAKVNMTFLKGNSGRQIPNIDFVEQQLIAQPKEFNTNLQFSYELNGFKRNGKNPFYCRSTIYWDFDDYMYYTGVNNNDYSNRHKHFYHEFYSTEEMNAYVNECANRLVEEIERQISMNKG